MTAARLRARMFTEIGAGGPVLLRRGGMRRGPPAGRPATLTTNHNGWDAQCMKKTMLLKLVPTPDQHPPLLETLHALNAAGTYAAEMAFAPPTANKIKLQR